MKWILHQSKSSQNGPHSSTPPSPVGVVHLNGHLLEDGGGGGGGGGAATAGGGGGGVASKPEGMSGSASKMGSEGAIPGPKSEVMNKSPAI